MRYLLLLVLLDLEAIETEITKLDASITKLQEILSDPDSAETPAELYLDIIRTNHVLTIQLEEHYVLLPTEPEGERTWRIPEILPSLAVGRER